MNQDGVSRQSRFENKEVILVVAGGNNRKVIGTSLVVGSVFSENIAVEGISSNFERSMDVGVIPYVDRAGGSRSDQDDSILGEEDGGLVSDSANLDLVVNSGVDKISLTVNVDGDLNRDETLTSTKENDLRKVLVSSNKVSLETVRVFKTFGIKSVLGSTFKIKNSHILDVNTKNSLVATESPIPNMDIGTILS
jgi:hypothetical protein